MKPACHPKSSQGCKFEHNCPRTNPELWLLPDVLKREFKEWPGGDDCPGRKIQ